ncbi:MAG TPA: radical SAM protein [Candidatus Acidoferrales bacterium]|nr:radical SAM protein [Candidatus Acidoferrales bacterium]
MTRILLTTVDQDFGLYDYYRENAPERFRWRFQMPRRISFGLRFLRQNLPEINIVEYPTRTEYLAALKKGWDVVGFSFYLEESNHVEGMAEEARKAGVKSLWAGNYGALTPSLQSRFDNVFSGYSEDAVAQALGKTIDVVRHPPLVSEFRLPGGWPMPIGILFTTRGCSFPCTFCQTTAFAPRPKAIPLESIEEALRFYVAHGIHYVLILDENFGNIPQQAEAVIEMLARYKVNWLVQSRVDLFLRNFDMWIAKGMEGALFGIESFHQEVLKQIHKGEKVEAVMELAQRLNRAGKYAHGYYIIGFPSETPESIAADLKTLASMELDVTQITIVTPHPRTQLWNELDSTYGIFEKNLSKYDTKHLVWNHPQCPPGSLESLLKQGFEVCYGKDWLRRTSGKFLKSRLRRGDLGNLFLSPLHARWAEPRRLPYLEAR